MLPREVQLKGSQICTFECCCLISSDNCGYVKQTWLTVSGNSCLTIAGPAVGLHLCLKQCCQCFPMLPDKCKLELHEMLNCSSACSGAAVVTITLHLIFYRQTSCCSVLPPCSVQPSFDCLCVFTISLLISDCMKRK